MVVRSFDSNCLSVVIEQKLTFFFASGKCKSRIENDKQGHPGCNCPDKYTGDHCEFIKGSEPAAAKTLSVPAEEGDMGIMWALVVILLALIAVISAMIVMGKKKAKMQKGNQDTIENAEDEIEEEEVVMEPMPSPDKSIYEPPSPDGKRTLAII